MNKQRKRFPLQKINNNDGIFEIKKCKCNCAGDLEEGNEIMYIGAKKDDNGFMKMVKREEKIVTKGNCIIFICDGEGSVGYSNYMDKDFIGSTTLSVGYNENLNANIGMFLVTLLDLERKKYSYGRKYGSNLGNVKIKLPADNSGNPDRKFMEDYIKSLYYKSITTKNKSGRNKLNIHKRKEFKVGEVLKCSTTKLSIKDDLDVGEIPLISRTAINNGCDGYFDIEKSKITKKGCITIGAEGIYAFYQPEDFGTGNKVYTLKNDKLNKYNALFICTVLNKEDYKYSYGRARILSKIIDEIIKLPIDKNGNLDREFMENYIKNLPYGDRI